MSRLRWLLVAGFLVLVGTGGAVAVLGSGSAVEEARAPKAGGRVGCAARGSVSRDGAVTHFGTGGYSNLVAVGAGSVWTVVSRRGGEQGPERLSVMGLDPRTGGSRRYSYRGSGEERIRVGYGAVWLADPQTRAVTRIDLSGAPRTVVRPFRGGAPRELAVGAGGVWVVDAARPRLAELDPTSGAVLRSMTIAGVTDLADVAVDAHRIWLTDGESGNVIRVSVATGRRVGRPTRVGEQALDVEVDGARAWVDLGDRDALAEVDARGRIARRAADNGGDAFAIALGFGGVWVTNYGKNTVTRIDVRTGTRVGSPIAVGEAPKGIAAGAGAVWVANAGDCTLSAIRP